MKLDKSMIETAYEVLEKSDGSLTFAELADKVAEALEMNEEEKKARLGSLYTSLSLNGKFVTLTDNTWDLRSRHTYAKVHIDVNDVYTEVEESEEEPEEENEEGEAKDGDDDILAEDEGEDGEKKMSEEEIESLGINK